MSASFRSTVENICRLAAVYEQETPSADAKSATAPERSKAEQSLFQSISDLSDDDKREVLALFWYGRGDFDNLDDAANHAKGFRVEDVAGYLIDKRKLSEPLKRGLGRG